MNSQSFPQLQIHLYEVEVDFLFFFGGGVENSMVADNIAANMIWFVGSVENGSLKMQSLCSEFYISEFWNYEECENNEIVMIL